MRSDDEQDAARVGMTGPWALLPGLFVPLAALVVLAVFLNLDPAPGVTWSNSPFTDEAWNVLNARNLVVLGRWSTDQWNRQLVSIPFMASQVVAFAVAGVGIIQARLVSVIATVLTVLALSWGLRRPYGTWPAVIAAVAFATSALVLYYARLALLEPSVALWLTLGSLCVLAAGGPRAGRLGIAAGLCFALAMGTKPNAAFAVGGMLLALGLLEGRSSSSVRRWLAGSLASLLVAGAAWVVLVYLPNRADVANVLQSWPAEPLPRTAGELWRRLVGYVSVDNDQVLALSAPLLVGGSLGGLIALLPLPNSRRAGRSPERRLTAIAAVWALCVLASLVALPYHPNRYAVPALPACAILVASGLATGRSMLRGRLARSVLVGAGLAILVALSLPGLLHYEGWVSSAKATVPAIQAGLRDAVPAGAVVEGRYAPLFLMRAPVVTLFNVPAWHLNDGDLYKTSGVRWVVTAAEVMPDWAKGTESAIWSRREQVFCTAWASERSVCLYRLP